MASSRKSSRSSTEFEDLAARVARQLQGIVKPSDHLSVALSGGVDSVVLLDCLQRLSRKLRLRLSALHINHQLSPNATRWSVFCQCLCRSRGVPFASATVNVQRGDSLEAAARAARYAVFARQDCDYVALAHHRDDQVETFLLQLLRGAGVKGLAAMPLLRDEGRGRRAEGKNKPPHTRESSSLIPHPSSLKILRPLLDVTRAEILEYARKRGLKWIEDESNQDIYYQRNFIRHEVLPVITRRFPAYRATLARASRHLSEAAGLLEDLAGIDAAGHIEEGTLAVAALRRLSPARARNVLRYFLAGCGLAMPGAERLEEALRQALTARRDAGVRIDLDGTSLRLHAGRLHVQESGGAPSRRFARQWRGEREIALPELGGVLVLARGRGDGISLARLRGGAVTIRVRRGGERLQPDCRRPRRSLKNLLQEAGIPPWERGRLPLIFCGGDLVWAAGIGVDCRYQAAAVEPSIRPTWGAVMRRRWRR